MSLPLYIALYLKQTPKEKKLIQQLYHNQKTNTASFIKGKSLCKKASCASETRKRLKRKNRALNNIMFECRARYGKNGRQTTDEYVLTQEFKNALAWIEICYGLNPKKKKYKPMIEHAEREEKCSPPLYENVPPLVKTNLSRDRDKRTPLNPLKKEYINPIVEKIKIPEKDKKLLSCYPEFAIAKSIEDAVWFQLKGNKIYDPINFMISRINSHIEKQNSLIKNGSRLEHP